MAEMTADVELLPLPEPLLVRGDIGGLYTGRECQHYARANMEPLLAEVERLRAEVELWRHKAAVHQYRRKRLAEALRDARDCAESHLGLLIADNMSGGVEQTKALITKIDAALAQEDRNG